MKTISRLTTMMIPVLLCCCAVRAQAGRKTATVHLRIVNFNDAADDLGTANVETFEGEYGDIPSGNLAGRFHGNVAHGVPYDFYRLCARTTGFWTGCTEVPVYQPEVWVVLGLRFGSAGLAGLSDLTGTVENARDGKIPVWVRLLGVYSGMAVDTKVDSSGHFRMSGIPPGEWILVTMQKGRILDTRAITISFPETGPVRIDLGGRSAHAGRS